MTTMYWDKGFQEDLAVGVDTGTKRSPTGGSLAVTQIGRHTFAVGQVATSAAWTPTAAGQAAGTVPNGSKASTTVTVPDTALGDFAQAAFSLSLQGCQLSAEVSATNTVTVTLSNLTGASVIFAAGTVRVLVDKSR